MMSKNEIKIKLCGDGDQKNPYVYEVCGDMDCCVCKKKLDNGFWDSTIKKVKCRRCLIRGGGLFFSEVQYYPAIRKR